MQKNKPIEVQLKGLEGWKNMDGKVSPVASISILDVSGKEMEVANDILSKTLGSTMPADKKELTIKYTPEMKLQTGQFYFAWIRLRDANSTKAAMDVVVKFYVED
ncbi:MAG: hypothetical protein IT244_07460 [Bacteroidia bacterium]|nr:hypothetical protein [Bacteroidia bacterium]